MKLNRAAFAVILKFSSKANDFQAFCKKVKQAAGKVGKNEAQLKKHLESSCPELLKMLG